MTMSLKCSILQRGYPVVKSLVQSGRCTRSPVTGPVPSPVPSPCPVTGHVAIPPLPPRQDRGHPTGQTTLQAVHLLQSRRMTFLLFYLNKMYSAAIPVKL